MHYHLLCSVHRNHFGPCSVHTYMCDFFVLVNYVCICSYPRPTQCTCTIICSCPLQMHYHLFQYLFSACALHLCLSYLFLLSCCPLDFTLTASLAVLSTIPQCQDQCKHRRPAGNAVSAQCPCTTPCQETVVQYTLTTHCPRVLIQCTTSCSLGI